MQIEKLLKSLERKHPRYIDLSLDRVLKLLEELGNPHLSLPPVVHVAGTNGKGSTIAFLRAILEAAGLTVHVYTSPHLVRFNERIVVAGKEINNNDLCELLKVIDKATDTCPVTFFEATTALAFLAFSRIPADVVLLETGLGGRLDATNVIPNPALTVITPISIDHKEYLGDTLEAITREKFGIVKAGTPCVIGIPSSDTPPKMEGCISEGKAELYFCNGKDYFVKDDAYVSKAMTIPLTHLSLAGEHQKINAATAIACIENLPFSISEKNIINGLANATWRGRMQQVAPDIWLDGGHNKDAGRAISEHIRQQWGDTPVVLVMGMLNNKEIKDYLQYFKGLVECVYGVNITEGHANFTAEEIANIASSIGIKSKSADTYKQALENIFHEHKNPVRVLICGSLYLAGEVLKDYEK